MSLLHVKSSEAKFKDSILALQSAFSYFDGLGSEGANGSVNRDKLREGIRESIGIDVSESEARDIIRAIDLNDNDKIEFNEFLKMMDTAKAQLEFNEEEEEDEKGGGSDASDGDEEKESDRERRRAQRLMDRESEYVMGRSDARAVFERMDKDGDGYISFKELKQVFMEHGENYADEEIHAMIHLVDPSNTGLISFQSFLRLMLAPE